MSNCTCDNAPGGGSCEKGQMAVCVSRYGNCEVSCVTLTASVGNAIQSHGDYPRLIGELLDEYFGVHHTLDDVGEFQHEINLIYKRGDGTNVYVNVDKDSSASSSSESEAIQQQIYAKSQYLTGEA